MFWFGLTNFHIVQVALELTRKPRIYHTPSYAFLGMDTHPLIHPSSPHPSYQVPTQSSKVQLDIQSLVMPSLVPSLESKEIFVFLSPLLLYAVVLWFLLFCCFIRTQNRILPRALRA